jgi:hypothetical protein
MKLPEKFALAATSLTAAVSTSILLYTHFNPPRYEPPEIKIRLRIEHTHEPSEPAEIAPSLPYAETLRHIRLRGAAP